MGMPEGKALILDTTSLLDRQEVAVEASRMDGDNFRRNLVTILAELRAGLAVYAPSSMRLVSLTPIAPQPLAGSGRCVEPVREDCKHEHHQT
ncbi:Phage major capsid protein, HK97 family [Pseudomonas amygdali]|uniref:hypothetical protein n=1 Tax=Pseudomonas amygdali TaxID=47877 RepID=UPI0006E573E1|nr:hypothetical protein [Pseudomonas amygdali]KPW43115.1 Phage major capsid protein, HK97 family [Pseudomonas amygdali]